jgi:hypothetical protein
VLAGACALAVTLLRRPGDAAAAAITTTVVMVVAAISPQHAWQQPILRLAGAITGIAVGVTAAWVACEPPGVIGADGSPSPMEASCLRRP